MKFCFLIFCPILFFSAVVFYDEYNLTKPDKKYVLPSSLNEISGIVFLNENEIACVQDELGVIYIYDLLKEKITNEYKTNLIGDFEGITLVGNTIYLLRSDGVLVEYPDFRSPNQKIKEHHLHLPTLNNEGLCYDKKNDRLLIAAKIKPGISSKNNANENLDNNIRHIYSFDLKSKVPNNTPLLTLNIADIKTAAIKFNIPIRYRIDKKTGQKIDMFNFRPSEISVHPVNGTIYILSANDKLLMIIDNLGEIKNLIPLDPILFNKAEGLAFLLDGTMLISNEAQKKQPTMLSFKYYNSN